MSDVKRICEDIARMAGLIPVEVADKDDRVADDAPAIYARGSCLPVARWRVDGNRFLWKRALGGGSDTDIAPSDARVVSDPGTPPPPSHSEHATPRRETREHL